MTTENKPQTRASNLLILDDETESRQALALLLTSDGFQVHQAATAQEAEDQLASGRIGIVLIDSDMPGISGYELCRGIRKNHGNSVYIILRTTKEDLFSRELAADEGADDFLIEPVNDKEILARVETGRKMKQLQEKLDETGKALAMLEVTDSLTGVYNKRRTDDEIDREMERARRYARPLSILLVDIDGFRSLNEAHGRAAGDRTLEEIARVLRLSTRATDSVGRYGAEEFAVILPETEQEKAMGAAEKLRKIIAQTAIAAGDKSVHVTVSIGVATFVENNYASVGEFSAAANQALAQAKAAGKNRCVAV